MISSASYKRVGWPYSGEAFFLLQGLESFSLSMKTAHSRMGAIGSVMQMGKLGFTNAWCYPIAQGTSSLSSSKVFFLYNMGQANIFINFSRLFSIQEDVATTWWWMGEERQQKARFQMALHSCPSVLLSSSTIFLNPFFIFFEIFINE